MNRIMKVFLICVVLILGFAISTGVLSIKNYKLKVDREELNKQIESIQASLSNTESSINQLYDVIDTQDEQIHILEEKVAESPKSGYEARLTYYHLDDGTGSGDCTGSGKCIDDFQVNEKGWYTYKGKLVLAAATYECINQKTGNGCGKYNTVHKGKVYYRYWNEVVVTINGVRYSAIILDSCGESMKKDKTIIDIYVNGGESKIDTQIMVY